MGKKLAIIGHPTRGNEVIKLLEMMGGKNCYILSGLFTDYGYYFIGGPHNDEICGVEYIFSNEDICLFTLEEFLEKYPFKIGDKVIDEADGCPGVVSEMKWDEDVSDMKYFVAFGNGIDFGWYANDSIEFCEENKNLDENKFPSFEPMFKMNDELEYKIPDGYEITEVSKNTVFIKPIKPKYPASYVECCEVIANSKHYAMNEHYTDVNKLLQTFQTILICRNAYWKIAGKEMGLDKSWEPDLENEELYCIQNYNKQITISRTNTAFNKILIFPFEEMRDAFYENFKDLIEQCKELL